jgi:RNA polymerase sigma-70 factor (ECF subfamily)
MKSLLLLDSETELVIRAQSGEQGAFCELVEPYRGHLKGMALRILRDQEDASDAVQESLIKAFRAIAKFEAGRPILPWLARICNNCCVDIIRQRKGSSENIDKYEFALTSGVDIEDSAEVAMEGELVRESIMRLPARYREIVMMRHFRQMEVNEIAAVMHRPEGTVKSWLFRARAMLRKDLDPKLKTAS